MQNLNYYDTFIAVAADCPAEWGMEPPLKAAGKTKARLEYELLTEHPYHYTQEQLLFEVYARHKALPQDELAERGDELRAGFFAKPQACMRSSALPKRYGWGVHFDAKGRAALVPRESDTYERFSGNAGGNVRVVPAMRNSRG